MGNVICDLEVERCLQHFQEMLKVPVEKIVEFMDTPIHYDYETGVISTSEFINLANNYFGTNVSEQRIANAWNAMIGNIAPARLALLKSLSESHQVLVLSNTNALHEHYFEEKIRNEHGTSGLKDHVHLPIYSHHIGLRKPNREIYDYVAERYLNEPSKALFLDDKPENVKAAISAGWNAVQVRYPNQIFEILSDE